MALIYKTGNLLDAPEPIIAHGCNAQGVMGAGVAKAIRDRYPEVFREYRRVYEENGGYLDLGEVIWVDTGRHQVANIITQENYGRDPNTQYVDYDAVQRGFRTIREEIESMQGVPIETAWLAIPRIGAGLGGGDWDTISAMIEYDMDGIDVVVYDLE